MRWCLGRITAEQCLLICCWLSLNHLLSLFLVQQQMKSRRFEEEMVKQAKKKDMNVCRTLMAEVEKHEDGWPFLAPVSRKRVS